MPFDESTPPVLGEQVVAPTEMPPAQPAAEAAQPAAPAGVETFAPHVAGSETPAPAEQHGFTMSVEAPQQPEAPSAETAPTPIPVTAAEESPQTVEVTQPSAAEADQSVPEEPAPEAPAMEAQVASAEEQVADGVTEAAAPEVPAVESEPAPVGPADQESTVGDGEKQVLDTPEKAWEEGIASLHDSYDKELPAGERLQLVKMAGAYFDLSHKMFLKEQGIAPAEGAESERQAA